MNFSESDFLNVGGGSDYLADTSYLDIDEDPNRSGRSLIKLFISQYLTTIISCPVHVAGVLMSLQYLPRPTLPRDSQVEQEDDQSEVEDDYSFLQDDDEDEGEVSSLNSENNWSSSNTDIKTGYLKPVVIKPEHQLKSMRGSTWDAIKTILRHKDEGFLSLWKGFIPLYVSELGYSVLQPLLEDHLNEKFDLYDNTVMPLEYQPYFWPNLTTQMISSVVTNFILSPLELMNVRMIAQSSDPLHKSFDTSLSALLLRPTSWKTLIPSIYPRPILTIAYHSLREVLGNTVQSLFIGRFLKITQKTNPLWYFMATFSMMTLELIIILPIRSIRRRSMLFYQPHLFVKTDSVPSVKYPCVSIRPTGFDSIFSGIASIINTEAVGYKNPISRSKRSKAHKSEICNPDGILWGWIGGMAQLYRGFWFQTSSNFLLCALGALSGLEIFDENDPYYF